MADLIAHGGFDVLTRILASDRDYPGEHEKHRRLHLVRAAHEAFAPYYSRPRNITTRKHASESHLQRRSVPPQAGQLVKGGCIPRLPAALAVSSTASGGNLLLLDRVQGDNEHDPRRERRLPDWCSSIASLLRIRQFERKTKNRRTTVTGRRHGRDMGQAWNQAAQLVLASLPIVWSLLVMPP